MTLIEAGEIAGGSSGKSGGLLGDWATPRCLAPLSFKTHEELAKKHDGRNAWGYRYVRCAEVELEAQGSPHKDEQPRTSTGGHQRTPEQLDEVPSDLTWLRPGTLKSYSEIGTSGKSAQLNSLLYTRSVAGLAESAGAKIIRNSQVTRINYTPDQKRVVSVS